jgi:hypothetical protein
MAKKNEVIIDTLIRLLKEIEAHNADYHHVTRKQFIRFVEQLVRKLQRKGQRYEHFSGKTGDLEKR